MEQRYDLSEYQHVKDFLRSIGLPRTAWTRRLMVKECLERDLEVKRGPTEATILIGDGTKEYTWRGGNTTFNRRLAHRLVIHKDATSKLLRSFGFSFPQGALFKAGEQERAWSWAETMLPVVV